MGYGWQEHANELDYRGTENHDVERREKKEDQRKHELHAHFRRPLLGALAPLYA
jgi:hypothetical protein